METIEISVDGTLRADAQQVLADEGLTIPEAFNMFLQTVVHDRTMPGIYRVPNEETLAALRELDSKDLPTAHSVEELMRALREED